MTVSFERRFYKGPCMGLWMVCIFYGKVHSINDNFTGLFVTDDFGTLRLVGA